MFVIGVTMPAYRDTVRLANDIPSAASALEFEISPRTSKARSRILPSYGERLWMGVMCSFQQGLPRSANIIPEGLLRLKEWNLRRNACDF